jgi:hypothetical protein
MSDPIVKRDPLGRILQGSSGNPGGRPRAVRELIEVARASVPKALALAVQFMDDERVDPRVRLEAAKLITSYGIGTPHKQQDDHDERERQEILAMSDAELEKHARQILAARVPPLVRIPKRFREGEVVDAVAEDADLTE